MRVEDKTWNTELFCRRYDSKRSFAFKLETENYENGTFEVLLLSLVIHYGYCIMCYRYYTLYYCYCILYYRYCILYYRYCIRYYGYCCVLWLLLWVVVIVFCTSKVCQ